MRVTLALRARYTRLSGRATVIRLYAQYTRCFVRYI